MAFVQNTRAAAPIAAPVVGFFNTLAERVARYRVYRDTVVELTKLSDRELADLGLARQNLRAVAFEAAYGA